MLKKSLVAFLFSLALALGFGSSGALAVDLSGTIGVVKALEEIEATNAKIHEEIKKAQQMSHELYDKKVEDLGKEKNIEKHAEIEAKYEEQVVSLIANLDLQTKALTAKGIEKADENGIIVEVEWILVQFADREAWIDPIRVLGW